MSNAAAVLTNTNLHNPNSPQQQQNQQLEMQDLQHQPQQLQQQQQQHSSLMNVAAANPNNGVSNNNGVASSNVSAQSFASGQRDDGTVVGLHYKIGKKIGEGSFGVLFEGVNLINGVQVAIKFEPRKSEAPQLRDEYKTYKILNDCPGIPHAYYLGQQGLHNILVIDLLGPSLEDLFEWCSRRFSVKTVVQVAVQMITLLEEVHNHDLIYRDIKPDNFLIGRPGTNSENMVHLIDFGMAKQYRDPKTKKHIPYREKKSLSGTARYMSINTHLGREQSRRDDMESLGHVFFYFLRGQLPWQGLKAANNKQKYEKIGEKKRLTNVYDLAQGVPVQFGRYLDIVRNLDFEEVPDYEGYRQLLISALTDQNLSMDGEYDWMQLNGGKGWDLSINKKPNLHGYGRPNPVTDKNKKRGAQQHNAAAANMNNGTTTNLGMNTNNNTNTNVALQQQQSQQHLQQQQAQTRLQNSNAALAEPLDPDSYEAYQKQTEQKYQKEQLKQQQQQQQPQGQGQRYYQQQGTGQGQPRFATSNNIAGGYGQQGITSNNQYRQANTPNYLSQQSQSNSQGLANGGRGFASPQPAYAAGYPNGKQGNAYNTSPQQNAQQQQQHHQQQQQNQYNGDDQESDRGFFSKLGCC
ncbi:hypothetical protein ACO0QE_000998 [Hanseniaspora vineae]